MEYRNGVRGRDASLGPYHLAVAGRPINLTDRMQAQTQGRIIEAYKPKPYKRETGSSEFKTGAQLHTRLLKMGSWRREAGGNRL